MKRIPLKESITQYVVCTNCWAKAGEPCKTPSGVKTRNPHMVRQKRFRKHQAYQRALELATLAG